ncbi:hypothetical protein E2C01_027730 [Portunus trituberculatus]|uniref:Uncharacterized protein n=1 Tax=Portunus trituberculatus TaxID=210409 RepID=A0A5B7ELN6_PORTR|nr:hypothetical protein [Portunus trituberculatus]
MEEESLADSSTSLPLPLLPVARSRPYSEALWRFTSIAFNRFCLKIIVMREELVVVSNSMAGRGACRGD